MSESLPETYISNRHIARVMADAEYYLFTKAKFEAEDGYPLSAITMYQDINDSGVKEASLLINMLENVQLEIYGQASPDVLETRRQIEAGRFVTCTQVATEIQNLYSQIV
jgi:hypothetical protein